MVKSLISLGFEINNGGDNCQTGVESVPQEAQQAIVIGANLFIVYDALTYGVLNVPRDFDSVISNGALYYRNHFDAAADDTDAKDYYCWAILYLCYHAAYANADLLSSWMNEASQALWQQTMDWYWLFNKVIPYINRRLSSYPLRVRFAPDINLAKFGTDQDFLYYAVPRGQGDDPNRVFCELGAPSSKTYGLVPPRYSSAGIILLVATVIIAAVAVVATVIATTLYVQRKIAYKRQVMATKANSAKESFEAAVNGEINPETGKKYTKAEQKALFNQYYKCCKRYNRWSFLWGGETYSIINGWDDGTSDTSSDAYDAVTQFSEYLGVSSASATYSNEDILKRIG